MLLEALKEEDHGSLAGDDLMKTLNEIAQKSATERPLMDSDAIFHSPIEKCEKDKLNTKERRSSRFLQFSEKEALQCRANSLKRAMRSIADYSQQIRDKRYSVQCDNVCVFTSSSSDTSPWSSPVPPINIISPSVSTTQLTCLSPLPDLRYDSVDEYFFNSLNLPVPKQFADSRRSSGVPDEERRNSVSSATSITTAIRVDGECSEIFQLCKHQDNRKSPDYLETNKSTTTTTTEDNSDDKLNICRMGYLAYSETEQRDDGFGFMPFEIYERNLLRNQSTAPTNMSPSLNAIATTIHQSPPTIVTQYAQTNTVANGGGGNVLQIPQTNIGIERLHPLAYVKESTCGGNAVGDNIYESESITLIDTDQQVRNDFAGLTDDTNKDIAFLQHERSSSIDSGGEASDILSAISNEEVSLTSEILDKQAESCSQQSQFIHVADIIQDLESDRLNHIDSPETSDETTEALHDESLLDDMSSVLGQDILGAMQDITITEDTTTLCTEKPRKKSLRKKKNTAPMVRANSEETGENPLQFGFENIVFEIDNRCDDQKAKEPVRYCSLAQFVEGNDIARKSFKVNGMEF